MNLPETILLDELVPPGRHWTQIVRQGQSLRIIDLEGDQGVDFLCYNAESTEERYHAPNTIKASGTLRLTTGHVLYSDVARPIMTITEDTCGYHDTIGECCSEPSNEMLYGATNCPGCRENFLKGLHEHGLGRKDIVPNINFFCKVPVLDQGLFEPGVFVSGHSVAGNYVELKAEMDALVVISNCPQINNPCNDGEPSAIKVLIY